MKKLIILSTLLFNLNLISMKSVLDSNVIQFNTNINTFSQFKSPAENEKLNSLRKQFSEALNSRNSENVYNILYNTLKEYHYFFDNRQKIFLSFVMGFIECIKFENLIYLKSIFPVNANITHLSLINQLSEYKKKHDIDLDEINIYTCNGFDTCLLNLAIKLCPSPKMLKFLIEEGIIINKANSNGDTLLHILAILPEDEAILAIAQCLIKNRIEIWAINNQRLSAYDIAREYENIQLAQMLGNTMQYQALRKIY